MTGSEYRDALLAQAVLAIDAGDVRTLSQLLTTHPQLARQRFEYGEGYFARPYLLWFVAENPVRTDRLPANIVDVAQEILKSVPEPRPSDFQEQVDGALGLIASGRVPREQGMQRALLDLLVEAGARAESALLAALAHKELDAVERLLELGAPLDLVTAECTGRTADAERLAARATAEERRLALVGAAFYGREAALRSLIALGTDVNVYGPPGFHPHATALHQAVDSGNLDAVRTLTKAGANCQARDRMYDGTPLDWAEYLGRSEIAAYLRALTT